MSKSVTIIGRGAAARVPRSQGTGLYAGSRKDHLKVWREIYQDVRRQWAEAESYRSRGSK